VAPSYFVQSLELAVLAGTIIAIAIAVGVWTFTAFTAEAKTVAVVYPISAYVDKNWNFLLCVYNAGPGDWHGQWLVSTATGRSVEIQLSAPVGKVVGVTGSLAETYAPGTVLTLIVVTGSGGRYVLNAPVVVALGSC
jgi:hypothetical protein